MKEKNIKTMKKNEKKEVKSSYMMRFPIFIQFVLAILLVIIAIMSLFVQELFVVVELLMITFLWVAAYNNYKINKKMGFVILYIIGGFLVLYNIIMAFV